MFIGTYWAQRQESRDEVASRVATLLSSISSQALFSQWFKLGRSKAAALRAPVSTDSTTIAKLLQAHHRDFGGGLIQELGFSLMLWNGGRVSVSVRAGGYSKHVGNSAVLSFENDPNQLDESGRRRVLDAMIEAFDPDHGIVTSHEYLNHMGVSNPWEAGWLTYERGGEVKEHPSSCKD